ncbi:hemolysin III family protein [Inquilinus sp. CAU 1745]|uniref:PAQR family membrane homeostasis protein TrhA n=1 Tax=Inquilinus sp. CAU 1745 TaxID=3140369 RepID=UPI00325C0F5A
MADSRKTYASESLAEQIANMATHGIGALLAVAGLVVLTVSASLHGTALHIVAVTIYGVTLVLLYLASTVYHSVRGPRARSICRMLDHAAIFLLIAGTYTPFALISMGGVWGWGMFVTIWTLAVAGVLFKIFFRVHGGPVSLIFYLSMGWIGIVAIGEMIASVDAGGLVWLMIGALAYTGGIVFYVWERLPFNHAVWHLFVLAGSASHFIAIAGYVGPAAWA